MWWIGPSCSRPCLSAVVIGVGGEVEESARAIALALQSSPSSELLLCKGLTVHVASDLAPLIASQPISVDLVVLVVTRGANERALALLAQLPPDLRCGRALLVAEPDPDNPHGLDAAPTPVIYERWTEAEATGRLTDRICHTFRRSLLIKP